MSILNLKLWDQTGLRPSLERKKIQLEGVQRVRRKRATGFSGTGPPLPPSTSVHPILVLSFAPSAPSLNLWFSPSALVSPTASTEHFGVLSLPL